MDSTAAFYSRPTYSGAGGAGFTVFSGSRRQRGGGIFGSLARMVLPVVKHVGKSVLSSVGEQGMGLVKDVGQSILRGEGVQGIKQTLRQQGLKRLKNVGQTAFDAATRPRRFDTSIDPSLRTVALLGKRAQRASASGPPSKRRRKRQRRDTSAANF